MRATRVIDRVHTHARQDTYFFNTKSHTAYLNFQTDVQGSEATLPCPGIRSAFQDVLRPCSLIRPHCSLLTNYYKYYQKKCVANVLLIITIWKEKNVFYFV
jgi:hypothetical protein